MGVERKGRKKKRASWSAWSLYYAQAESRHAYIVTAWLKDGAKILNNKIHVKLVGHATLTGCNGPALSLFLSTTPNHVVLRHDVDEDTSSAKVACNLFRTSGSGMGWTLRGTVRGDSPDFSKPHA